VTKRAHERRGRGMIVISAGADQYARHGVEAVPLGQRPRRGRKTEREAAAAARTECPASSRGGSEALRTVRDGAWRNTMAATSSRCSTRARCSRARWPSRSTVAQAIRVFPDSSGVRGRYEMMSRAAPTLA
jgi:hypothetical protein